MRVIEQQIIVAIRRKENFKKAPRDEVYFTESGDLEVSLWGHIVAHTEGTVLILNDCGYATSTTASRINAVCEALNVPIHYSYGSGGYFVHDGELYHTCSVKYNLEEGELI